MPRVKIERLSDAELAGIIAKQEELAHAGAISIEDSPPPTKKRKAREEEAPLGVPAKQEPMSPTSIARAIAAHNLLASEGTVSIVDSPDRVGGSTLDENLEDNGRGVCDGAASA